MLISMPANAYAIERPKAIIGLQDIAMARKDPTMSLRVSPFAADGGTDVMSVGAAVPWKGTVGIANLREKNPEVAAGLERAISISKSCAGVKGTEMVGGRLLTKKAVCQIKKAK